MKPKSNQKKSAIKFAEVRWFKDELCICTSENVTEVNFIRGKDVFKFSLPIKAKKK